jgi:hypothetical protein
MYGVTLRHIRVITVATEKQEVLHIVSVCVCNRRYPARKLHAPYHIVMWPVCLYNIFHVIS